jgi:hypothetical protein
MNKITPEHIQRILMNPFYAIQVASELVEEHEPRMSDKEWVTVNTSLIQELGDEQWLRQLLDVLQGNTVAADERINPFNAINIDPMFALDHPSLVSQDQWVQANVLLIPQMGTEQWLMQLLDVLEGDFVTAADMDLTPSPTAGFPRVRKGKHKSKKQRRKSR